MGHEEELRDAIANLDASKGAVWLAFNSVLEQKSFKKKTGDF
jgi:hypothetical protein